MLQDTSHILSKSLVLHLINNTSLVSLHLPEEFVPEISICPIFRFPDHVPSFFMPVEMYY